MTATTEDVDLQFVLVDNGSVEPETLSLLERLETRHDVTVVRDDRSFNWAALNNAAVDAARGDVLLFLNNDIEARHSGWLGVLAAQALRPDVAAVGARLVYPGGRVQHAGVVIGIGAAGHTFVGLPADQPGYLGMAVLTRDCSAVTGACMASRRDLFEELGGFDEELGIDTNDIDFCLRARERGYRVLYEPLAELIHYESPSRGKTGTVPDIRRFMLRWNQQIETGDPFLNPHLTRLDGSCALRRPEEEEQLHQWRRDPAERMNQSGQDTGGDPPSPPRLLERAPREHQTMSSMREHRPGRAAPTVGGGPRRRARRCRRSAVGHGSPRQGGQADRFGRSRRF